MGNQRPSDFPGRAIKEFKTIAEQIGNDGYATMLELLEVALPGNIVAGMRKDVEGLLGKCDGCLHVTARGLRKQLGI